MLLTKLNLLRLSYFSFIFTPIELLQQVSHAIVVPLALAHLCHVNPLNFKATWTFALNLCLQAILLVLGDKHTWLHSHAVFCGSAFYREQAALSRLMLN